MVDVKICGISSVNDYKVCLAAGARWVGMVYYPGSSRHLDSHALANLSGNISKLFNGGPKRVLLTVDQTHETLRHLIKAARPNYLQLHGKESVELADALKVEFNLPIIKMIPISTYKDVDECAIWESIADWLIFDAKTEKGLQPGGTGHSFDWRILKNYDGKTPWMLAGGLNARTVAKAIRTSGAQAVDVSSGVESKAGKKDKNKIHDFIRATQMG